MTSLIKPFVVTKLNYMFELVIGAVASSIIGGGGGGGGNFLYSCSAQLISVEIFFMVCEHEYMNLSPPPPAPPPVIIELATAL